MDVGCVSVMQLRARDPVLCAMSAQLSREHSATHKMHAYWSQAWNRLDAVALSVFWAGLVMFAPYYQLQVIGRFLLSVDVFFFFMKIFHMLMVFDELGLMLVMVFKMVSFYMCVFKNNFITVRCL